jgi:two-component system response regulator AtoC
VPVNCGAIPENLLESELFGHVKGAFTGAIKAKEGLFQTAHKGTLFLDEIGELPLSLQVKLLRVLETELVRPVGATVAVKVDVRLVAATSRVMDVEIRAGRFREDLFYRLNVLHLHVPPLRRRPEDIPPLVDHFLERFSRKFGRKLGSLTPSAMDAVLAYDWPGNIRELENALERAVLLSERPEIGPDGFPPEVRRGHSGRMRADDDDLSIKRRTASLEAELIQRALERTGGNRTRACKLLQLSHRALLYKIKDYGIQIPPQGRPAG